MKSTRANPVSVNSIGSGNLYTNPVYRDFKKQWQAYCKDNQIGGEEEIIKTGVCWHVVYRNRVSVFIHTRKSGNPVTIEITSSYGRVSVIVSDNWIEF